MATIILTLEHTHCNFIAQLMNSNNVWTRAGQWVDAWKKQLLKKEAWCTKMPVSLSQQTGKRQIFQCQFHPLFSLCGVTAGVWPAARPSSMCRLLSTLISHAKLRASQPQTATAREPQATSRDISASLRLQVTPALEPPAPSAHTKNILYVTRLSKKLNLARKDPIPIYSGTKTQTHAYTQGSSPFNTKAQQLSCIFMERESGPTPENINRSCGADLSFFLFWKWMKVRKTSKNSTPTKRQTHYKKKHQD